MAHILVVDDDADLRQLLLTALERDGHQVTALDRGSAVTEAHCRWAHCILLDVMMPGEDGFATCQRVRALADCPILFLTAKTEEADVIQGLDFDLGEKAVYWGEQPVKLTRGEYAICEYLALHSGQTFSKEQIYEAVFGFDAPGDQAAVTEHIKNIRAKLRALDCHPIDTVWGVGYRWKRDLP